MPQTLLELDDFNTSVLNTLPLFVFVTDELRGDGRWSAIMCGKGNFWLCHEQFGLQSAKACVKWCLILSVSAHPLKPPPFERQVEETNPWRMLYFATWGTHISLCTYCWVYLVSIAGGVRLPELDNEENKQLFYLGEPKCKKCHVMVLVMELLLSPHVNSSVVIATANSWFCFFVLVLTPWTLDRERLNRHVAKVVCVPGIRTIMIESYKQDRSFAIWLQL